MTYPKLVERTTYPPNPNYTDLQPKQSVQTPTFDYSDPGSSAAWHAEDLKRTSAIGNSWKEKKIHDMKSEKVLRTKKGGGRRGAC